MRPWSPLLSGGSAVLIVGQRTEVHVGSLPIGPILSMSDSLLRAAHQHSTSFTLLLARVPLICVVGLCTSPRYRV